MRHKSPILVMGASLAVLACTPQAGAPAPEEPTASATPDTASQAPATATPGGEAPVDAPTTLAGEWRVAGIDGAEFDEPYGIALSADDDEIWWSPRCAGPSIRYRIEGARFIAVPPPAPPPPPPGAEPPPPQAVCAIGLPERLPEVMNAIRAADRIERTPANGILLSGQGRSLTLFSQ